MLPTGPLPRREFLRLGALGIAGTAIAGPMSACGTSAGDEPRPDASRGRRPGRVLLVYFSRAGENYFNGGRRNLKVGNTEVLADLIVERLRCDVHRIEAADPYSSDYDDTVARNVREQQRDARPAIANPLRSIDDYDTVLLASPIWNVQPPMIMHTFTESHDFTGRTVYPVTTHAMSGLGTAPDAYRAACRGARIGDGLAVRGEHARSAGARVDAWVRRAGLARRRADAR